MLDVVPHLPDTGIISSMRPEHRNLPRYPLLSVPVPAGFPSPATDFSDDSLNLDDYLIENQEATFFVRVTGNSMTGFGIYDGDLLVVDRSKTPTDRQIIIAVIDGAFTVKQLCRIPNGVLLRSHGSGHGDILVSEEQELTVWGVVRWAIHRV